MPRTKRVSSGTESASKKQKTFTSYDSLLEALDTLQDDEQTRQLVTAFVKLPSKKMYPDYYALIEEPVSLNEIQKKVSKELYPDAASFVADFKLMHDNAVKYNDPDSWIVEDAKKILEFVEENLPEGTDVHAEGSSSDSLPKLCLDLLDDVIQHDFPGEGPLSGPFIEDVNQDDFPDYFQLIETPTSFNDVKTKISESLFSDDLPVADNLQAFHNATILIFSNAQTYNDPSSLIHEDSVKLENYFEEKFAALKKQLLSDSKTGLKLTLKAPKEPVKLKLSLRNKSAAVSPAVSEEPPKKRRGRKPKKLIEEEQRRAALEAKLKNEDSENAQEDEQDVDEETELPPTESCAMGKSSTVPPSDEVFIRRVAFTSSPSAASQCMNNLSSQPQQQLSKAQALKYAFYPDVPVFNSATFFDYQFEPLGFSSKAYSISLPQDSSPVVNFKVALHELIYNIKRDDLVDGHGILKGKAEEDFMCSLHLNDEEVAGGCEIMEEVDPTDSETKLLNLIYDLKLSYGLNILNFELRLSPSLSKSLRKKNTEHEPEEVAGRHTRHQLQQIKLNWDVEKFTLFVVSLGA